MTLHRILATLVMTRARHARTVVTWHTKRVKDVDMRIINKYKQNVPCSVLVSTYSLEIFLKLKVISCFTK